MLNGFMYGKAITKDEKILDFLILEINKPFEKISGLSSKFLIGKKDSEVFPNEFFNEQTNETMRRIVFKREPVIFEYLSTGRLKKWWNISAYSPKQGYIVFLFEDITKRKELEKNIENYTKNLEKLVEERTVQLKDKERLATIGETAGMVGHDIRNPLQAIVGDMYIIKSEIDKIDTIRENGSKQTVLENMQDIDENINYIDKIVSDLQDYTKHLKPNIQEVNISNLIKKSLLSIKIPRNIETVFLVKDLNFRVDPEYIKRIITNLVLNAVQAMPNGGKLTIEAYEKGGDNIIVISDTGIGIPNEIKPKLFSPLFTTKSKGQGFGLSVTKRLIESLGGTVTFESEEGKGTAFTVRLPASRDKR